MAQQITTTMTKHVRHAREKQPLSHRYSKKHPTQIMLRRQCRRRTEARQSFTLADEMLLMSSAVHNGR